jgi:hypothetical protein
MRSRSVPEAIAQRAGGDRAIASGGRVRHRIPQ